MLRFRSLSILIVSALVAAACQYVPGSDASIDANLGTCMGEPLTHVFGHWSGVDQFGNPVGDPADGAVYPDDADPAVDLSGDDVILVTSGPVTVHAGTGDDKICVRENPYGFGFATDDVIVYGGPGVDQIEWPENLATPPPSPYVDDIEDLLDQYRDATGVFGVSAAVMHNDQLVFAGGAGVISLWPVIQADENSVYRIASLSKNVTAMLALRVLDQTNTSIDTVANSVFPLEEALPPGNTYTIKQLLRHRSGIRHYRSSGSTTDSCGNTAPDVVENGPYATMSEARYVVTSLMPPDGTAALGTIGDYCYSTHAFTVLGATIEELEPGQTFYDQLAHNITEDLDVGTLTEEKSVPNQSWIFENGAVVPGEDLTWKLPGGGMQASALDMVRLGQRALDGQVGDLTAFSRSNWDGDNLIEHSGRQEGARSYWRIDIADNMSIAVLSNDRANPDFIRALVDDIEARTKSAEHPPACFDTPGMYTDVVLDGPITFTACDVGQSFHLVGIYQGDESNGPIIENYRDYADASTSLTITPGDGFYEQLATGNSNGFAQLSFRYVVPGTGYTSEFRSTIRFQPAPTP